MKRQGRRIGRNEITEREEKMEENGRKKMGRKRRNDDKSDGK